MSLAPTVWSLCGCPLKSRRAVSAAQTTCHVREKGKLCTFLRNAGIDQTDASKGSSLEVRVRVLLCFLADVCIPHRPVELSITKDANRANFICADQGRVSPSALSDVFSDEACTQDVKLTSLVPGATLEKGNSGDHILTVPTLPEGQRQLFYKCTYGEGKECKVKITVSAAPQQSSTTTSTTTSGSVPLSPSVSPTLSGLAVGLVLSIALN